MLTAIHEAYTRGEVQGTMQSIFDAQYEIILTETIEIRTRTETRTGTDPTTGDTYTYEVEVQYEWRILNITLLNFGIDSVARGMLSGDDLDRYDILQETQGNRPELFGGVSVGYGSDGSGESGIDYECRRKRSATPSSPPCWRKRKSTWGRPTSGAARRPRQALTVPGTSAGCSISPAGTWGVPPPTACGSRQPKCRNTRPSRAI